MTVDYTWAYVAEALERSTPGACVAIHKSSIAHPLAAGLRSTIGAPRGQLGDYLLSRSPTSWMHVVELGELYEARLVTRTPSAQKPRRRSSDSGAILGLLAGLALGGTAGAGLVGLLLGGVAGSASRRGATELDEDGGRSDQRTRNQRRKG